MTTLADAGQAKMKKKTDEAVSWCTAIDSNCGTILEQYKSWTKIVLRVREEERRNIENDKTWSLNKMECAEFMVLA